MAKLYITVFCSCVTDWEACFGLPAESPGLENPFTSPVYQQGGCQEDQFWPGRYARQRGFEAVAAETSPTIWHRNAAWRKPA